MSFSLERFSIVALTLFLFASLTHAVPIGSMVTDDPNNTHDNVANLRQVVVGGGVYDFSKGEIIGVSSAVASNNSQVYIGRNNPGAIPGNAADVFTDLDVVSGKANSVDINVIFSAPLSNGNGDIPDIALVELGFGNQTDSYTLTPIVGGSAAAPVFGGTSFTFNQDTEFADTGQDLRIRRSASEDLTQDMVAGAIDLAQLGITGGQQLIGLRVESAGGDPSLIVGLQDSTGLTAPSVLFEDNFDVDPASNGWIEALSDTGNAGDIFQNGSGQVVFASDGLGIEGNDFDTRSITRTIDASGFADLTLFLEASEDETLEGDDVLSILVDDGSGFTTLFSQADDFGTLTLGQISLDDFADSVFDLRIQGVSNVEPFLLDRLVVTGRSIVPEPATALLGLMGVAGIAARRRRQAA